METAKIDLVRDYQNRALSVMGRASALLDTDAPDCMALGQCRWELTRLLRAYQIHKHRYVFDPIIATGSDPDRVRLAHELKTNCIAVGDHFRDHVVRWSATGIGGAWPAYRTATQALIAAVRAHIARERAGIAALEAAGDRLPLPASTAAVPSRSPRLRY